MWRLLPNISMFSTDKVLRAPFPYFGGKALAADLIWSRFGSAVKNYVEPFFGSGAVLINRPEEVSLTSSVANDIDGYVCNFWRAVQADSDGVAHYANSQVNEIDLHARHQWLVDHRGVLTENLKSDPEYYCSKSAGWWAWGCCCWIGGGWCKDPRNAGTGVNRQIPRLGDAGTGVNRKIPNNGNNDSHELRADYLKNWIALLSEKTRNTRFTSGDWKRICSVGTMTRFGRCAILLDPPYGTTKAVYAIDSETISAEVQSWCLENGSNEKLAIALCGHSGQHEILEEHGWEACAWRNNGGYQGGDDRERIWFSPGCDLPSNDRSQKELTLF